MVMGVIVIGLPFWLMWKGQYETLIYSIIFVYIPMIVIIVWAYRDIFILKKY